MLSQSVLARPLPPVKQQAEREAAQPQLSLAVGETFQHLLNFVSQRDLLAWLTGWALQTSQQRQIVRFGRMYVNLENSK